MVINKKLRIQKWKTWVDTTERYQVEYFGAMTKIDDGTISNRTEQVKQFFIKPMLDFVN